MRTIEFPEAWGTARPIDSRSFKTAGGHLFGVLLDDGVNLWALIFEGGHRFMRTQAPDSALLEQEIILSGEPLDDEREAVEAMWDRLRAIDTRSAIEADSELRRQ